MDNSTILFVATLLIAFGVLRWLIAPISHSVPEEFHVEDPLRPRARSGPSDSVRSRRQVTDSMIEVVQSIGPQLSAAQIRYSLERTGSVEATVDEYMENGSLPSPPGSQPPEAEERAVCSESILQGKANLLEKYGISINGLAEKDEPAPSTKNWGSDENERVQILQKRREEMILRARKRVEQSEQQ